MVLTMMKLNQANKQLEAKEKEKVEAEQAESDLGITKVVESLTA